MFRANPMRTGSARRWVAVLVLAVMVLSACGGGSSDTTTAAPTTTTSASGGNTVTTTTEAVVEGEGLVIDGEVIAGAELWEAAQDEGRLLVYVVHSIHLAERFYSAFTEQTGIEVEIVQMPSGQLLERVLTEQGAGVLEADILATSDFAIAQRYIDEELWLPFEAPTIDDLDPQLVHPEGYWFAFPYPIVIIYNTEQVSEPPASWDAFTDPAFAGRNGVLTAGLGGSSFALAMFQRQEFGEEFWEAHAANEPVLYNGQTPLSEAVARGELLIGAVQTALYRDQVVAGAPVGVVWPEAGMPTASAMYGLSAYSANPNAAELHMNWLLSQAGGAVYQDVYMDYSPNTKLPAPVDADSGVEAPPRDLLWYPSPQDVVDLRDDWVAEWDEIMAGRASSGS